ncbi:MAG: YdeI/OmpD-associated family protein [Saprospiraceae bacterium]
MITFNSTVAMLDSQVYGYYLTVPKKISSQYQSTDRRMICVLNVDVKIHCALMPKSNGEYMILLNKELRKKLNLKLGDTLMIQLEKDNSEYGMVLPEELVELWEIDPDGYRVFHTLTKGKQRALIYQMSQSKRSETKAKKIVAILEYLKTVNGKLDFREMNQFVKNYNAL